MKRRRGRRTTGAVDQLPSGRYRVRILDPSTGRRISIGTFDTKREADAAHVRASNAQHLGQWVTPDVGRVAFAEYAKDWMRDRLTSRGEPLRPRVIELYEGLLRLHINPRFGDVPLENITTPAVRAWYSNLRATGPGRSTAAKGYRLMRAVLNTAVEDGLIPSNPCTIKGAGVERTPERAIPTIGEVFALADAVPERLRAVVLLGAFAGLRRSEIFGLTRQDIDLEAGTVAVERQRQQGKHGEVLVGPPKTEAGQRTVSIPPSLVADLRLHLDHWVGPEPRALVVVGEKGAPLRPHVWQKAWDGARQSVGLERLHFHDLRHVAGTLAATTGASTKELMSRLGHASPQAALRYQHATKERDEVIARGIDRLIKDERQREDKRPERGSPGMGLGL